MKRKIEGKSGCSRMKMRQTEIQLIVGATDGQFPLVVDINEKSLHRSIPTYYIIILTYTSYVRAILSYYIKLYISSSYNWTWLSLIFGKVIKVEEPRTLVIFFFVFFMIESINLIWRNNKCIPYCSKWHLVQLL